MEELEKTLNELQIAIEKVIKEDLCESSEVAELVSASSKAVGLLKMYKDFNLPKMTRDMALLAGMAGSWPSSWDKDEKK